MKYGIASWNKKFANKWQENVGDKDAEFITTTDNPMLAGGAMATITSDKTDGEEIAKEQGAKLFEADFIAARVKWDEMYTELSKYYIVCLKSQEDLAICHLPGAVSYNPKEMFGKDQKLNTLPTDKPILVYCYTGMNAAFTVAYLRMLGYDAYTLLYGANGLMYSKLKDKEGKAFKDSDVHNFEFNTSEFQGEAGGGGGGC